MPSTFSPNLRVELIGAGEQAGTWGTTTNRNLGTLLEGSIAGRSAISVTSAAQAFTALDGVDDQARKAIISLTTTTTADFAVYAPPASKLYVIQNSSAYTATVYNSTVIGNTTAAGTGVAIPAGKTIAVVSDGVNFTAQTSHLPALTLGTDLAVADGGTGASTFTNGGILRGNGTSALSVASAADIVAAIGATAVQNATNATTAATATALANTLGIAEGGTGQTTAANAFNALKQPATETATGVVELATTAEASAGTDTTRAVTAAGVEAHMNANALGWGQTWQDVTGSRASGTTYTNSTGRPIMVAVTAGSGTSSSVIVIVAGAEIVRQLLQVGGAAFQASASFIVPHGETYAVSVSPSIANWRELR